MRWNRAERSCACFLCFCAAVGVMLQTEGPVERSGFALQNFTQTELDPVVYLEGEVEHIVPAGERVTTITQRTPFRRTEHTEYGPDPGVLLSGTQLPATHSLFLTVPYGSLVRQEYDLYDPEGDTVYHIDREVFLPAEPISYSLLCHLDEPSWIQHARLANAVFSYPDAQALVEAVERDPSFFINSPEL